MIQVVPYYQNWHECQIIRLEGPDLARQQQQQLLSSARDTSSDSIQQFDDIMFHVASESWPGSYYEINLHQGTCNCPDFLRARFCKHLAAISLHFPHLCTQEKPSRAPVFWGAPNPPERVRDPEVSWASSPQGSLQKLMEDVTGRRDTSLRTRRQSCLQAGYGREGRSNWTLTAVLWLEGLSRNTEIHIPRTRRLNLEPFDDSKTTFYTTLPFQNLMSFQRHLFARDRSRPHYSGPFYL